MIAALRAVLVLTCSWSVASSALAVVCDRPVRPSRAAWPTGGNCFYDVVLNDLVGAYSARTATQHPVTELGITRLVEGRQTLAMGGGHVLSGYSRCLSLRSWTAGRDYRFDTLADTLTEDRGFGCRGSAGFGPPAILEILDGEGQVIGLEGTYVIDEPPDAFEVRIRIVAHGTQFEDSAVEVTASVRNLSPFEARVGIRQAWAVGMVSSNAIALGPVPPDPPLELWSSRETTWVEPEWDYFLASYTNSPSRLDPYYFGGVSVHGPWTLHPPPTAPEVIVTGADWTGTPPEERWGPGNTCFAWEPPVPPRGGPVLPGWGSNESAAYFWGRTPESSIPLAPGESRSFTVWFWAFVENPVTCATGGPYRVECTGSPTSIPLDGTGSRTVAGNALQHRWSSGAPGVMAEPADAAASQLRVPGAGTWPVRLDVGIGPFVRWCETSVEVVDSTPPVLALPADVLIRTSELEPGSCRARVELRAEARDACSPDVVVTHRTVPDVGSGGDVAELELGLGTTRVIFRATDPSGNSVERDVLVTVLDDVPPRLTVTASPELLWPPNHRLRDVSLVLEAEDDCTARPEVRLVAVTSSEAPDATGDGSTSRDILSAELGTPDSRVRLRAERSGGGAGRTYELRYEATDASGNRSESSAIVRVPHDQSP